MKLTFISGLAGAWEALFAYDMVIFSLTLYKSRQMREENARLGRGGLLDLIVRDGMSHHISCSSVVAYQGSTGAIYFA